MIQVLLSRITPTLTETTVPGSLGTAKKAYKTRNLNYKNDRRGFLSPCSSENCFTKILGYLARPQRSFPKDRDRSDIEWVISHY